MRQHPQGGCKQKEIERQWGIGVESNVEDQQDRATLVKTD